MCPPSAWHFLSSDGLCINYLWCAKQSVLHRWVYQKHTQASDKLGKAGKGGELKVGEGLGGGGAWFMAAKGWNPLQSTVTKYKNLSFKQAFVRRTSGIWKHSGHYPKLSWVALSFSHPRLSLQGHPSMLQPRFCAIKPKPEEPGQCTFWSAWAISKYWHTRKSSSGLYCPYCCWRSPEITPETVVCVWAEKGYMFTIAAF